MPVFLVKLPEAGEVMTMVGGWVAMSTLAVCCVEFPAASVATTTKVCGPSGNDATESCQAFWVTVAGMPSTVTVVAVSSCTVPCTITGSEPSTAPAEGAAIERVGGVRSKVTWTVFVLTFPAASVATRVKVLGPSLDMVTLWLNAPLVTGAGLPLMVRVTGAASVTVPWTICVAWFVINPSGGVVTVMTGGTESMTTGTWAVPTFPAASWLVAIMLSGPSTTGIWVLNVPSGFNIVEMPFTSVMVGEASATEPVTVITGPFI